MNNSLVFKLALAQHQRKSAFVEMSEKTGQQAAGPGGAPVDPAAGGAPMDPMAAGGAPPMDPMAGGMPPMPPMDPMAGGAPPMDPMAGGMPPMDPMAAMGGLPPLDPMAAPEGEGGGDAAITTPDADTLKQIQQNTMDLVRQTLEMVGKAKPMEGGAAADKPAEVDPATQPGPITGQPGFDPSILGGPLKLASVKRKLACKAILSRHLKR